MRANVDILLDALKSCSDHYTHLFARFSALDTKAQSTATMGSVFLGAVLAFMPHSEFHRLLTLAPIVTPIAVRILVSLASITVVLGYWAMKVRSARAPFRSDAFAHSALTVTGLALAERTDDIVRLHYEQQLRNWQVAIEEIALAIKKKGRLVFAAQLCIVFCAIVATAAVWFSVVGFKDARPG